MNVSQYRGLLLQVNSGTPLPHRIPVEDFWTQTESNIGELIKTVFASKLIDCSTDKSTTFQSKSNISISGSSPNENNGKSLRPDNDDQTHFVAGESNEPAEDVDMLSSLTQGCE